MNILLALYQNFSCNSANHADGIARVLCAMGCDCIVVVPAEPARSELMGDAPYKTGTFDQVLRHELKFANGGPINIAHFWTPREINRLFWEKLRTGDPRFATVIHMEDNEELIARSQLRGAYDEFVSGQRTEDFPIHLSHPKHSRKFLEDADGITVIIESLLDLVPPGKPVELAWPSTDEEHFYPHPIKPELRAELGIKPGETVLAYHGNMHQANFREVRSLYLAVAMLNREGTPARLLRMGRDHIDVDPGYRKWADEFAINVGFVPGRDRLAEILSQADVFVQPGLCDAFNEYRFPSKVPDFLALGRPLILPRTNIALAMRHGIDAFILEEATGPFIADAIKTIMGDDALRRRLACGAREFFDANLGWPSTAVKLHQLYRRILNKPAPPTFVEPTEGEIMNLTRLYAEKKFPALSYATVRDFCDSSDNLEFLCHVNDLKDVQRPWCVKALIGELKAGESVLEIGAGEPVVASFMNALGWPATVCDPYDGSGNGPTDYDRYARQYPKLKIIRSKFDQSVAEPLRGQVDAVYSISVLEYLPASALDTLFEAIETALKPGGLSLHCADAVVQGNGTEYYVDHMAKIFQHQNRLAGIERPWEECYEMVRSMCATAVQDLETFFLGPQGHNQWRGKMKYDEFPFRKCISVQFVARKKE